MTENLAGRGEGLAGRIEEIVCRGKHKRGGPACQASCGIQVQMILAALDVLNWCSRHGINFKRDEMCSVCLAAIQDVGFRCFHPAIEKGKCLQCGAALATPSPQALAGDRTFSTTEQTPSSMATAAGSPSASAGSPKHREWLDVAMEQGCQCGYSDAWHCAVKQGLKRISCPCLCHKYISVPAATQEPAGSGATSIASTSVTTPRKITWFCRICERDHTAYCPAVGEDNFLHLCDHCGQSFQGNQHECPSPSALPLEQFFRNRFNAEWTPELERELLEIIAARNSAGSPRKVGEDGAQTFEQWWASIHKFSTDSDRLDHTVLVLSAPFAARREAAELAWQAALARPSSVPVGEQKQEEGV